MRWDGMGWDGTGRDGTGRGAMRWDGNGTGRDGVAWDADVTAPLCQIEPARPHSDGSLVSDDYAPASVDFYMRLTREWVDRMAEKCDKGEAVSHANEL